MNQDNKDKKEDSKLTREEAVSRWKKRIDRDAQYPEGHPPPTKGISTFTKSLLFTAIPIAIIPLLIPLAIILGIILSKKDEGDVSGGIWTGIIIGSAVSLIGYGITCFVALSQS